jgi:hypothetical protein
VIQEGRFSGPEKAAEYSYGQSLHEASIRFGSVSILCATKLQKEVAAAARCRWFTRETDRLEHLVEPGLPCAKEAGQDGNGELAEGAFVVARAAAS